MVDGAERPGISYVVCPRISCVMWYDPTVGKQISAPLMHAENVEYCFSLLNDLLQIALICSPALLTCYIMMIMLLLLLVVCRR